MFDYRKLELTDTSGAEYHLLAYSSSAKGILEVLTVSSSGETDEQTFILRQYNRPERTFRYLSEGENLLDLKNNPPNPEFAELISGSISEQILSAVEEAI